MPETRSSKDDPRTCPKCGRVVKNSAGLGGHLAAHNRADGIPPQKRNPRRPSTPVVIKEQRAYTNPVMDAVDICSTVLQAMNPNGILPHHRIRPFFNWIKATELFLEEMSGDSK